MRWDKGDERGGLEPGGVYPAEVTQAEDTVSKKGNPMLAIVLRVFDGANAYTMRDWLLPAMPKKLKHFCDATGLLQAYEECELDPTACVGRECYVVMSVERNDKGYLSIEDYGTEDQAKAIQQKPKAKEYTETIPKPPRTPAGIPENDVPF